MATLNPATYFGLKNTGAIAPGYHADIVLLSDLKDMRVEKVFKNGELIVDGNRTPALRDPEISSDILNRVYNSFHCRALVPEDFIVDAGKASDASDTFRSIQLIKGEIGTKEVRVPLKGKTPEISVKDDVLKIAAIERHHNTNHIGLGFVKGYGLKKGAIASSVSHDSHNIIAIGTNDVDLAAAANCIRDMQGGWAIALKGEIIAKLPLSIAGLMSDLDAVTLAENIRELKQITRSLGVEEGIDPFMTLAFVSLPVIPELRLITTGLFDVSHQQLVSIIV
jgi:adenine deaminase